jgi:RNA polymerase sigma-70 factor (ECF subfamily)
MIRDIDYILEWMETGRRPGNKRGVERLAAYQREIPVDIMERYAAPPAHLTVQTNDSLEWEYRKMEYILSLLTDRERQCYEMNIGGMYSEREIAQMIGIAQPTVHENLKRAQNKIKQYKSRPMPLLLEIVV